MLALSVFRGRFRYPVLFGADQAATLVFVSTKNECSFLSASRALSPSRYALPNQRFAAPSFSLGWPTFSQGMSMAVTSRRLRIKTAYQQHAWVTAVRTFEWKCFPLCCIPRLYSPLLKVPHEDDPIAAQLRLLKQLTYARWFHKQRKFFFAFFLPLQPPKHLLCHLS